MTVHCAGCGDPIEDPTDDHYHDGEPYCHNCGYLATHDKGPLADDESDTSQ